MTLKGLNGSYDSFAELINDAERLGANKVISVRKERQRAEDERRKRLEEARLAKIREQQRAEDERRKRLEEARLAKVKEQQAEAERLKRLEEARLAKIKEQQQAEAERLKRLEEARLADIKQHRSYYLNEAVLQCFYEDKASESSSYGDGTTRYYGFKDSKTGKIVIPAIYSEVSSKEDWRSGERLLGRSIVNKAGEIIKKFSWSWWSGPKTVSGKKFSTENDENTYIDANGQVVWTEYDSLQANDDFYNEIAYKKGSIRGFLNPSTMSHIPVYQSKAVQNYISLKNKTLFHFIFVAILVFSVSYLLVDSSFGLFAKWTTLKWWQDALYIAGIVLVYVGLLASIASLDDSWPIEDAVDESDLIMGAVSYVVMFWVVKALCALWPILGDFWSWFGFIICSIVGLIAILPWAISVSALFPSIKYEKQISLDDISLKIGPWIAAIISVCVVVGNVAFNVHKMNKSIAAYETYMEQARVFENEKNYDASLQALQNARENIHGKKIRRKIDNSILNVTRAKDARIETLKVDIDKVWETYFKKKQGEITDVLNNNVVKYVRQADIKPVIDSTLRKNEELNVLLSDTGLYNENIRKINILKSYYNL